MENSIEQMLLKNRIQFPTQKKHEAFAIEFMTDYDMVRAYKKVYDENGDMDDLVAQKAAGRLLRSVVVQEVIDRETCNYIATKRVEKDDIVKRMHRLYLESMKDRDYASAKGALDMLAKHYGLYQAHNKQKRYSADELIGLRQKLEAHGVTFSELNKPKELDASNPYMIDDAVVETDKEELT